MENMPKMLLAVGLPAFFLIAVYCITGICFETNDDRLITEILSGSMTGEPNACVVYINYLLMAPLSWLYRICPGVPWYGGMLVLLLFLAFFAMIWSSYHKCDTKWQVLGVTAIWCFIFLPNLYTAAMVQYTSTSALLAVAGYCVLLLQKDKKKGILFFFLLELVSFLLRSQAMLMIQPMGCVIYLLKCVWDKKSDKRGKLREIGTFLGCIVLVLILGGVGNIVGYGEEWNEYNRFNKARTVMFDYYGVPDYDEVEDILDRYQVSEEEYDAFRNYVIIDWEIPVECAEELADYAQTRYEKSFDPGNIFESIKSIWNGDNNMCINIVCKCALLFLLIWSVLSRNWRLGVNGLILLLTHTVVLGYLVHQGRTPARVVYPFLMSLVFFLVSLVLCELQKVKFSKWGIVVLFVVGMLWGTNCGRSGLWQYYCAEANNHGQKIFTEELIVIRDYCNERPENRYLLDPWSFCYHTGGVFETRIYGQNNYLLGGSWYSNSPVHNTYAREYVAGDDLCYIVLDKGDDAENPVVKFLEKKIGKEAVLSEYITSAQGSRYCIFEF